MKKNRIKLSAPLLKSRASVESTLIDITLTTLNRNRAQLDMDREITAIRERHEATINTCNQDIEQKSELIRVWAEAHPEEFGKAKSLDLIHAVIGFRTGTPTLKTLRGWTWDRVLEAMRNSNFWNSYVRIKAEPNKQSLLIDRESLGDDKLKTIGLTVEQKESFFIEPKLTEQDNRVESAAS